MNPHIVMDVNIALDLLLKRPPAASAKATLFSQLKKSGAIFYVATCSLPSLEYIHEREIARLIQEGLCSMFESANVALYYRRRATKNRKND